MGIICVGILLILPLVDLIWKDYIESHFSKDTERSVLKGKIFIRRVHNEGMALNLLDRYPHVVKWCSLLFILPLFVYYIFLFRKEGNWGEKLSLSLLIGGACSNLYDRVVRNYVVDYLGFQSKWEKMRNITYNLGDFGIFIGAIGVVIRSIFSGS